MDKRKRRLLCMLEGSGWKSRWISGVPPLSFRTQAAGTLENYRIYGNTAGGESVGDKTENLFDENWIINDMWYFDNHLLKSVVTNTDSRGWDYNNAQLKFKLNAGTYTITMIPDDIPFSLQSGAAIYSDDNTFICGETRGYNTSHSHTYTFTLNQTTSLGLMFKVYDGSFYIMLNSGSTAKPYEPYGYKVPVTVTNGTGTVTTPIYLPEQIRKVGSEAEYIDYGEQKMHRIGADDIDVTLPALPTIKGTNVLSVGTAVQPSGIEVKGKIKAL